MNIQFLWKFALTIILMLFGFVLAAPTDVRAQVIQWIKVVAGFQLEERGESPILNGGEQITPIMTKESNATLADLASPVSATPTVAVYPTTAPQTILSNPPFAFGLPKYIPDGFILMDNGAIAKSNSWVSFAWSSQNAEIEMLVEQRYTDYPLPTGIDSAEEIQVNGQPALLIRGWWDENHNWDPTRGLALHWKIGDIHYRLIYYQRSPVNWEIEPISGDADQVLKDLINMAESVEQ